METMHVIMKMRDQELPFEGKCYPHWEVGWKKGDTFYLWNGLECKETDVEVWKVL